MSKIPEMSIIDTTKTFRETVHCGTVVKMFTDLKRDIKRIESIEYNFDSNKLSDRVYCQNPIKSVFITNEETSFVFARCNVCSLCTPSTMKSLS